MTKDVKSIYIIITLPIRTHSATNAREHWAPKARRAADQRGLAKREVLKRITPDLKKFFKSAKFFVHLVRIGPKKLDRGNYECSFKAVQDGIAQAIGVDDGDESRVIWTYDQCKDHGYAVHISINAVGRINGA